MRTKLEIILSAIIVGFIVYGSYFVFSNLFSHQNPKYIESFYGAFVGAFFAFLFVRFADALNRIHERHSKNNKALIVLEHHLNDRGSVVHDNIYTVDTFLSLMQEIKNNPEVPIIFPGIWHEIPLNKELIIDLINIDFINDLASYNMRTRKMNDSINTINRAYQHIKSSFLENSSEKSTYVHNLLAMKGDILTFRKFLVRLLEDTKVIVAKARILHRDIPFFSRIILLTFRKKYPKTFSKDLEKELATLSSEIETVGSESKERIDNILKNE